MRYFHSCFFVFFGLLFSMSLHAQYDFHTEKKLACTEVKNQQKTGTCWSFTTASFLESEMIRNGKTKKPNISEMFVVRKIYEDKAQNYVLRQGKANFGQGSLSHDLIRVAANHGIVPENEYSGKPNGEAFFDHSEMENVLKGYLDGVLATKNKSNLWRQGVNAILDIYLGEIPQQFTVDKRTYNAKSYAAHLGLSGNNYVSFTSFAHHPFYSTFVLEIPDNYSNGVYYNLPLDEFIGLIDFALIEGYTVAWDGDVSEKGFVAKKGLALLPLEPKRKDLFSRPGEEIAVTQANRQEQFENWSTTDDHLMHIVGMSFDQNGTKYYLLKNSWGEISPYKGYLYMSASYLQMKTISVMMHKSALPKKTAEKLFAVID